MQTTNAARSGLVDRAQIDDIAVKGRDFASYLKLLPGVVDTSAREAPGWGSMGGLSINGRTGGFNFSYDGVTNKDTGSNSGNYAAPALDSIAEVRVQTSNFQAEYGRSSGATVTVVTRSGSKDFHGSAAYYKRDDTWNGNEFSRRRNCGLGVTAQCKPPDYDFDNGAWTIGGPVLIPGASFNRGRNKLFFFWSQDILARTDPGGLQERRMPTQLERNGDFSQSTDNQGRLLFIRDPQIAGNCNVTTGGPACFDGNVIPGNRINATAQRLLNLFPMPNTAVNANFNNYAFQTVQDWPRNDQVLRVDYNIAQNTTMYGRLQYGYEKRAGPVSFLGSGGGWPQQPSKYEIDTVSYVNTLLHTFNPTLFGEVTVGVNWAHQYTSAFDDAAKAGNDRRNVLPGFPQFFPQANPDGILPNATFNGGTPGTVGSFNTDNRWTFFGFNTLWNVSGNITKIAGSHNMKAGLFVEHTTRPAQRASSYNGTLTFNTDGSNPLNTNVGFANALLGAITQYQESDGHPDAHGLFMNTEWYVQDNWRVKQNFTIDAGLRFYYLTPTQSDGDEVAAFGPNVWQAGQAPLLYTPVSTPQGRQAQNPVNGQIFPLVYLGRLVPGTGNFTNGMEVFDGTPQSKNPFKLAPRIGFAWDVTGDGKTAVRGGAGVFYDRYNDDNILDLVELPPLLNTYTTNYTTIPELLASPLTATPTAVRFIDQYDPPTVYNWSAGVQRDIGWNFVGDFAYVGNAARDQRVDNGAINGRPYGYAYQPSSLDSTNVIGGITQPLPDDLLRPYRGYGSITQRTYDGYGDYHSLQFSVNRRRSSDGLTFGVAYTRELSNKVLAGIDPFVADNHARNYRWVTGNDGSRKHIMNVNYSVRGAEPQHEVGQRRGQGAGRQLAGVGRHLDPEWRPSGLQLRLHGGADWCADRPGLHQRRRQPGQHPVRSHPAARRADVRAAVQDRVHRAPDRRVPARQLDQRRVHRAGLHELGHLVLQARADGRQPPPAVPDRALQRVQHRSVAADRDRHERDVQLRDRRADRHRVRQPDRRDAECAAHSARRAVHVLTVRHVDVGQALSRERLSVVRGTAAGPGMGRRSRRTGGAGARRRRHSGRTGRGTASRARRLRRTDAVREREQRAAAAARR